MPSYHIEGGIPLSGSITTNTNKNSTVAILCASLMLRGEVTIMDVPKIEEVERCIEILQSIGVSAVWKGPRTLALDTAKDLRMKKINRDACERTRASLLLFGALAAREKRSYKLYKSGGCKLGRRTVRPHVYALEKLGVHIKSAANYYLVSRKTLTSAEIVMYESGDTPTENAIMAAALAPGKTIIKFASANYMVQDLCYFLIAAGAKIDGIGTSTLVITGVKKLKSKVSYAVMPDPIEAFAWVALALTTRSAMTIKNCPIDFFELELEKLRVMGARFSVVKKRKSKNKKFSIADIAITPSELIALPDKITCGPFPDVNIDNLPLFAPILTQAKGRTLLHDWVYEDRAPYLLELQKLGANVMLIDPHRLFIEGNAPLTGAEIMCPPAIRPGMAILIAMLAAKGASTLRNIYPIERAYENVVERLRSIGAKIERS